MNKSVDILIGLQWGDEGKGKIVDYIGKNYDVVVRYQGGANSGHTVWNQGNKYVFHLLPSSIIYTETIGVLANGMVIDPVVLRKEIRGLEFSGLSVAKRLYVSGRAFLTLPVHIIADMMSEKGRGVVSIGSTLRGNTPTYVSKYNRTGLRMCDITHPSFKDKYERFVIGYCNIFGISIKELESYTIRDIPYKEYEAQWFEAMQYILDLNMIVPTDDLVIEAIDDGASVLMEGAQGHALDIDWGDYPYVTSSHVTAAAAFVGSGVPPTMIRNVYGVFKPYVTRVGRGFFPSELSKIDGLSEYEDIIRAAGNEYGATTGRPRRIGALDIPQLQHAIRTNGVTHLAMAKFDIAADIFRQKHLPIVESYTKDGGLISYSEASMYGDSGVTDVEMVYAPVKPIGDLGTMSRINGCAIALIESLLGKKISLISIGADRLQTIDNR